MSSQDDLTLFPARRSTEFPRSSLRSTPSMHSPSSSTASSWTASIPILLLVITCISVRSAQASPPPRTPAGAVALSDVLQRVGKMEPSSMGERDEMSRFLRVLMDLLPKDKQGQRVLQTLRGRYAHLESMDGSKWPDTRSINGAGGGGTKKQSAARGRARMDDPGQRILHSLAVVDLLRMHGLNRQRQTTTMVGEK